MPNLIEAEVYLRKAKAGEELSTDQRRHVVAYLMANSLQKLPTGMEMAALFNVSERTIRLDKEAVRKLASEEIKQEDIALVISDIRLSYQRYTERLENSLRKAVIGSRVYLDHLNAGQTMQLKMVESLQSLGWYPKNIGQLVKKEYKWTAVVTKDGTVDTRAVDMLDHLIENPNYDPEREALDAEFEDMPALAAHEEGSDSA